MILSFQIASYSALLASLLCLAQVIIVFFKGDPICLNEGCEIVEQLTTVPPLVFNLTGAAYFLSLFWLARQTKLGAGNSRTLYTILLTAGIAVEAVLINFQYSIAQVFCSYCLIIFAVVVLLNLLAGMRQTAVALVVFFGVSLAFASLHFTPSPKGGQDLTQGAIAYRQGTAPTAKGHLFFSSTCSHCEEVIEYLKDDDRPDVYFNPIDKVDNFSFPNSEIHPEYQPSINRGFLTSLDINEVPVLLIMGEKEMKIIRGANSILDEIKKLAQPEDDRYYGTSSIVPVPGLEEKDDGCTIDIDCEEETGTIPAD